MPGNEADATTDTEKDKEKIAIDVKSIIFYWSDAHVVRSVDSADVCALDESLAMSGPKWVREAGLCCLRSPSLSYSFQKQYVYWLVCEIGIEKGEPWMAFFKSLNDVSFLKLDGQQTGMALIT